MSRKSSLLLFLSLGIVLVIALAVLLVSLLFPSFQSADISSPIQSHKNGSSSLINNNTSLVHNNQSYSNISTITSSQLDNLTIPVLEILPEVVIGDTIPGKRSSGDDSAIDNDDGDSSANNDQQSSDDELSIYVYTSTLEEFSPNDLSNILLDMGVTRVFLSTRYSDLDNGEYRELIASFVSSFHEHDLVVAGLFMTSPNVFAYREKVFEFYGAFSDYQSSVSSNERFDELTFDIEPQALKDGRGYDSFQGHFWQGSDGYGLGGSNDVLLRETVAILEEINGLYSGHISQANTYFFHDKHLDGLTSYGSVNVFLDEVDEIIIMDYDNREDKIISRARAELEDASDNSITVCLKTKPSDVDTESLSEFTYGEFVELKDVLLNEFSEYDSFAGLCVYEFDSFYDVYKR